MTDVYALFFALISGW